MAYRIIGVHGLANKPPREPHEQDWRRALLEGLSRNHDVRPSDLDFELVYWADAMYPSPIPPAEDEEPYIPEPGSGPLRTYKDGWTAEMRAAVLGAAGSMFDAAKRWLGIDNVADAVLAKKLKDLSRYYEDGRIREDLRGRLRAAIERAAGRRMMIIAHSMGSIIAYDVLRALGKGKLGPVVDHLVTVGSPLGLPHVTYKIYEESSLVRTPSVVAQWTNFADRRDPVAVDVHLADDFDPNGRGIKVKDDLVINPYKGRSGKPNHHKIYGYLRAPEVSAAILRFI